MDEQKDKISFKDLEVKDFSAPRIVYYNGKQKTELKKVGDKYVMEFDDIPALLFVSYEGVGRMDQLFRFGKFIRNAQSLTIRSGLDEMTTFEVSKLAIGIKEGD